MEYVYHRTLRVGLVVWLVYLSYSPKSCPSMVESLLLLAEMALTRRCHRHRQPALPIRFLFVRPRTKEVRPQALKYLPKTYRSTVGSQGWSQGADY